MVVKIGEYEFIQTTESSHVLGSKDGRLVYHAQVDKRLTREELREYGQDAIKFIEEVRKK